MAADGCRWLPFWRLLSGGYRSLSAPAGPKGKREKGKGKREKGAETETKGPKDQETNGPRLFPFPPATGNLSVPPCQAAFYRGFAFLKAYRVVAGALLQGWVWARPGGLGTL